MSPSADPPCSSIVPASVAAQRIRSVAELHCRWIERCRRKRACFWDQFHAFAKRNVPPSEPKPQLSLSIPETEK